MVTFQDSLCNMLHTMLHHRWQRYFPRDGCNCSYIQCKVKQRHTKTEVTASELEEIDKICIHFYSLKPYTNMRYEPLVDWIAEDKTYTIDILWKTTWLFRDDRTSCTGTMQMIINKGEYTGQSSVVFMHMIDLNPSDETCIYSTLLWVSEHAKRYNVQCDPRHHIRPTTVALG